ncbi:ribonuclease III domain-containing protein [Aspergillus germanicus]
MALTSSATVIDEPTEERCHARPLISRSARRRRRRKLQQRFVSVQGGAPAEAAINKVPLLNPSTNASESALPSVLTVSEQFDPWAEWAAYLRASSMRLYETKICIEKNSSPGPTAAVVNMYTPVYLSRLVLEPLDIGSDTENPVKVSFIGCRRLPRVTLDRINALRQITSMILAATVPKYVQHDKDYLILLRPDLPHDRLTKWLDRTRDGMGKVGIDIVRASIPSLLIPILFHTLQIRLVAEKLCSTVLNEVEFSSIQHVLPAITTPYTRSQANYQRYEFFGDAILKYIVACQLFFEHPECSEGELSRTRNELVSNSRLTRAALELGLDAFVLDHRVSFRNWSAPSWSRKYRGVCCAWGRKMSAKVLADVVEALIGAAFLDGGLSRARACAQRLLPELRPRQMPFQPDFKVDPQDNCWVNSLQACLGYTFNNPSLLVEALTHPSCTSKSYQRLEFLGDAVLDMIIIRKLARHPTEIAQGEMSMIKHAASNRNILTFFCLNLVVGDKTRVLSSPHQNATAEAIMKPGLWRFMRFNAPLSPEQSQQAVLARYLVLRDEIIFGLQEAKEYPWQALIKLNADKYFSDLIESVLGAIYVDSSGDLAVCEGFLERIGLLGFLDRILRDCVDIAHPKNIVQRLSRSLAKFDIKRTLSAGGSDTIYECRVSIGDVIIAVAKSCLSHEEAEVEAAAAAIRRLQETPVDTLVGRNSCSG